MQDPRARRNRPPRAMTRRSRRVAAMERDEPVATLTRDRAMGGRRALVLGDGPHPLHAQAEKAPSLLDRLSRHLPSWLQAPVRFAGSSSLSYCIDAATMFTVHYT